MDASVLWWRWSSLCKLLMPRPLGAARWLPGIQPSFWSFWSIHFIPLTSRSTQSGRGQSSSGVPSKQASKRSPTRLFRPLPSLHGVCSVAPRWLPLPGSASPQHALCQQPPFSNSSLVRSAEPDKAACGPVSRYRHWGLPWRRMTTGGHLGSSGHSWCEILASQGGPCQPICQQRSGFKPQRHYYCHHVTHHEITFPRRRNHKGKVSIV